MMQSLRDVRRVRRSRRCVRLSDILSEWLESSLRLPEGISATPGPLRLWPYQRAIADAIDDSGIERVTVSRHFDRPKPPNETDASRRATAMVRKTPEGRPVACPRR